MTLTKAEEKLIIDAINKNIALAQSKTKKSIKPVVVKFSSTLGAIAGHCRTTGDFRSTITINTILFKENVQGFIERTIPHEVAHHVTWNIYGWYDSIAKSKVIAHGRHFRHVMKNILGCKDASTYHSYDTTNAVKFSSTVKTTRRKVAKTNEYKCSCGKTHLVSNLIQRRMQAGQVRICKTCRGKLVKVA